MLLEPIELLRELTPAPPRGGRGGRNAVAIVGARHDGSFQILRATAAMRHASGMPRVMKTMPSHQGMIIGAPPSPDSRCRHASPPSPFGTS